MKIGVIEAHFSKADMEEVDAEAMRSFGRTLSDSLEKQVCLCCEKPAFIFKTKKNAEEYVVFGLCQECQDQCEAEEAKDEANKEKLLGAISMILERSLKQTAGIKVPPMTEFKDDLSMLLFGRKRSETINENRCVTCTKEVGSFKDDISLREYKISGLCQKCQDSVFGG